MKVIGMIGGMSWESTTSYYRAINTLTNQRLGGFHSAKICLYSVDFAEIEALQRAGEWSKMADILSNAATSLESAGAECILICTNTMHKVAPEVQSSVSIPLIHIADPTGNALVSNGITKVGLLGTRFTMEQAFYRERIEKKFGVSVVVPNERQQADVHRVIYEELCHGQILDASKSIYLDVIDALSEQGAQAIILGCTEIALLVKPSDTAIPLYDTTHLHAQSAVEFALAKD
ncbi:aspartate/glutamate racemase family protein [Vibrio sp. S9_S30]|uniref:aspartate/glutamate racemase family protein n=1 Tax=Vibrio sp. S9_S30 TaxID=2720226 RepID=UPI00167FE582|nr:aspartate/glutamate racemase family protein [Vibrio sp. S9_S30]MBD1557099.1 aspartate/glutamate racemase family protein [Vibrio sp. S9_S30]